MLHNTLILNNMHAALATILSVNVFAKAVLSERLSWSVMRCENYRKRL